MIQKLVVKVANDYRLIILTYVVTLMCAAGMFALLEHRAYIDSLWWACVTSLTIGYGEIVPITVAGRCVAVVFSHFWALVVMPMIVANMIIRVIHDDNEFTDIEQEEIKNNLKLILKKLEEK